MVNLLKLTLCMLMAAVVSAEVALAQSTAPAWFLSDVSRGAAWLPPEVLEKGWDQAGMEYYLSLPTRVQQNLYNLGAPIWMLAIAPKTKSSQREIFKQLKMAQELSGQSSLSPLATRAEQLLLLTGALQLPTPGDNGTGKSLGSQGCTAAMTKYILAELKLEFPNEMTWLTDKIASSQSSSEILQFMKQVAQSHQSPVQILEIPYAQLSVESVEPGDFMIGQKPGGAHMFAWTRVPKAWNWSTESLMAIANTGLKNYGERMILAQEYLTDKMNDPTEPLHNAHGPINSGQVVYNGTSIDLSDPRTNVYAAENTTFIIIRLKQ